MKLKIPLKPNANPVKQGPYRLNPRYKEKVKVEIYGMLQVRIIEPIDESEWIITMIVHDKKTSEVYICGYLRKLNNALLHYPFLHLLQMRSWRV